MIKLKSLNLKNVGSFRQETIVFPSNGLLLVNGENGSGKSTIFKAIAYCLDFLVDPASELRNWDSEEEMLAELTLTLNAQDLVIKRGMGVHTLEFGSIKTQGAETVKKIKELLLLPDFIANMSYRGQDEDGNFSKLKPSEKQDMLSDLLSLGDFEKLIESTEVTIAKLDFDLNKKIQEETLLFSSAKSLVESIDKTDELIQAIDIRAAALIEQIESKKLDTTHIDSLVAQKRASKAALTPDTSSNDEIEAKSAALLAIKNSTLEYQQKDKTSQIWQFKLQSEVNEVTSHVAKIPKIQKEIERLQKDECPRCLQPWSESSTALEKLESELESIEGYKEDLLSLRRDQEEAYAEKEGIAAKIKELTKAYQDAVQEVEALKRKKDAGNFAFREHDQQIDALCNEKTYIERQFNTELKSLKNQLDALSQSRSQITKSAEENTKKVEELSSKLEGIAVEKDLLKVKVQEQNEILTATKDFLRLITEDTLKLISQESTKFVQNLPNAKSFYINFSTSKLNKNGKTKKEIVLQIFKNGKEVPFRRLSGGEKCSVHLATDLAVSQVLAMRTGKNLGWFILDESLNGQNQRNKKEALGMLKALSDHKLILIAEHTSETQEIFDQVLNVQKTETGSTVKLI